MNILVCVKYGTTSCSNRMCAFTLMMSAFPCIDLASAIVTCHHAVSLEIYVHDISCYKL